MTTLSFDDKFIATVARAIANTFEEPGNIDRVFTGAEVSRVLNKVADGMESGEEVEQ